MFIINKLIAEFFVRDSAKYTFWIIRVSQLSFHHFPSINPEKTNYTAFGEDMLIRNAVEYECV